MEFEDKQIIYVSSKDRTSGNSSSFLYDLQINPNNQFDKVVVLSASIPKSYYLISDDNNEFTLTELNISITLYIPNGNYTLTSLKAILIETLNSGSPNGWIYNVAYPNINDINDGKLTFTVINNNNNQPSFQFTEYIYEQMGFNPNTTYTFNNNILKSVNVINLQLLDAVFINSDICNNKTNSILQEIFSNTDDYSNMIYKCYSPEAYSKDIANKNGAYKFYLTTKYGNQINLNGLNWNFTLLLYKQNNLHSMIKNYLRYLLVQ